MQIFWAVIAGSVAHFIISFIVSFPLGFIEGFTKSPLNIPVWLGFTISQLEVAAAIAVAVYWYSRRRAV